MNDPLPVDFDQVDVSISVQFLRSLFRPTDLIVFRPIEAWNENGRKRSRVDYKATCYCKVSSLDFESTLRRLMAMSEGQRWNLFFGVCPRISGGGQFDLAWQIRTVRAVWTDIDHVTVPESLERVRTAGMPIPSIVVNSGNGAHLYWLLTEPLDIDDAEPPPPVQTEWIESKGGGKKPRKYIVEDGERVYLDQQPHVSRLSPKAIHVQNVLAGIAKAIGGDHTHDVSRLLRLPGSFNRKNQRNGSEPIPTELVACEPTRRYSFTELERLAKPSPESQRASQIAAMPLPRVRKPSAGRADKLAEFVAASAIAPAGSRSETDFALCCFAVKNGFDKENVWGQVESIGKFADGGRRYFDRTWENAEFEVRTSTFEKIASRQAPPQSHSTGDAVAATEATPGALAGGWNGDESDTSAGRPTIYVDSTTTPVADTLQQVTERLVAAENCFLRSGQLVVIHDAAIEAVLSPPELAGLLNQHVEFYFVDKGGGEYRPLTAPYANTWLNNRTVRGRMPEIKLFTRNPVFTEDWRIVAPGFDAASGIYYAGQVAAPRAGTQHLDDLLQDFCFKSLADRTNYVGLLLTAVLIPRFIGAKPAGLFNGNQPGLGKSILAQIIAILRDGAPTETASYNANDEEFEKRLGAIVRRGTTTIIIDNAKGHGRKARIDSACLERSVTDSILSFRLLGKSQEIRAENSHIFCITANTPDVSPDLVSRSVVINLQHEGDPKRRTFHVDDPEGYAEQHRWELLGELIGMVQRWLHAGLPKANVNTRFNKRGWGHIVGGILETNGLLGFLANAEAAAAELDETRREFTELVAALADHPRGIWTAAELVDLCRAEGLLANDLGDGSAKSLSTKMGVLSGRYIDEQFDLTDGRRAAFRRDEGRKGKLYRVAVLDEVPNLEGFAEPLPNLCDPIGSAPEFV